MKKYEELAQKLSDEAEIVSASPTDPVEVPFIPTPWQLVGCGNYAAVFTHPKYPDYVVKVYGRNREERLQELYVYDTIGDHPGYACCYGYGERHLILKRIKGITLFDCLHKGIRIPEKAIEDVDRSLAYARSKGLTPRDVHGKNVMLSEGRGIVVDVSDFTAEEECSKWADLKTAYYKLYQPFLSGRPFRIPYWVLNSIRVGYRLYKRIFKRK